MIGIDRKKVYRCLSDDGVSLDAKNRRMSFKERLNMIEELMDKKLTPEIITRLESIIETYISFRIPKAIVDIIDGMDFMLSIPQDIYSAILSKRYFVLDDPEEEKRLVAIIINRNLVTAADKVMLKKFDGMTIYVQCKQAYPIRELGYVVSKHSDNGIVNKGRVLSRVI